jgi:hypothetical protein
MRWAGYCWGAIEAMLLLLILADSLLRRLTSCSFDFDNLSLPSSLFSNLPAGSIFASESHF